MSTGIIDLASSDLARAVLVIKLGALGDIVQSMDAFHAIRAHHQGERLILLTTPPFAQFGRAMPWFEAVWIDTRPKAWQFWTWLALIRRLRAEPLRRVYDLQCNQRTRLYFRLLTSRRPEWSGEVRGCSHPRPPFLGMIGHNHSRLLEHVRSAGIPTNGVAELGWLDADVCRFGLPQRFALMVPGCSPHRIYKRWPAAYYADLAMRLEHQGVASVVIGTQADRKSVAELCAMAPNVINLCGNTNLLEVAGIARAALGAVGNDTGPVFITAAVGTPTLMLMSRHTIAERMAPLGPSVAWIQRECLGDLTVNEVEAALMLLLPPQPVRSGEPT
ncbi:MAG: glycosyltransferase family 9 protein [Rhodospirillaceae bacterium]